MGICEDVIFRTETVAIRVGGLKKVLKRCVRTNYSQIMWPKVVLAGLDENYTYTLLNVFRTIPGGFTFFQDDCKCMTTYW